VDKHYHGEPAAVLFDRSDKMKAFDTFCGERIAHPSLSATKTTNNNNIDLTDNDNIHLDK
jgi:hypothetical protein